ncbi:putative Competence lipoprotein ComL [Dirofilaria immitis]|nr:putative Competence lipoprotein ComL [Dirofilaria immitis]
MTDEKQHNIASVKLNESSNIVTDPTPCLKIGLYPLHRLIVENRAARCVDRCQLATVIPNFDLPISVHTAPPFCCLTDNSQNSDAPRLRILAMKNNRSGRIAFGRIGSGRVDRIKLIESGEESLTRPDSQPHKQHSTPTRKYVHGAASYDAFLSHHLDELSPRVVDWSLEEIKYGSCNAANDMDNYIQIYSNGEDLPYVYYLRVLSYYMQIHKVQLGQRAAYKTLDLATEYINFFPNSIYTEEKTVCVIFPENQQQQHDAVVKA